MKEKYSRNPRTDKDYPVFSLLELVMKVFASDHLVFL